jgi:hypothetical protein
MFQSYCGGVDTTSPLARLTDTHVHSLHRQTQPSSGKHKHLSLPFSLSWSLGSTLGPNLEFTVHASVYGKVLFLPQGLLSLLLLSPTTRPLHTILNIAWLAIC